MFKFLVQTSELVKIFQGYLNNFTDNLIVLDITTNYLMN
jgi:hypothetical protein